MRRKWIEPAPAPLPYLGTTRTDTRAAISLQREDAVGDRGRDLRSPQIIEFLSHRLRHIPGKLLIVWDGLPGHRSRAGWDFVQQQRGRWWLEFLPAYA